MKKRCYKLFQKHFKCKRISTIRTESTCLVSKKQSSGVRIILLANPGLFTGGGGAGGR